MVQMHHGIQMQLLLLTVVQLVPLLMVFLSILITRFIVLIEQMVASKSGLIIALIQHEHSPVICQVHILFLLRAPVIFMLTMKDRIFELINGHWMQLLVFLLCMLIHHVLVFLSIPPILFTVQCIISVKLSKNG